MLFFSTVVRSSYGMVQSNITIKKHFMGRTMYAPTCAASSSAVEIQPLHTSKRPRVKGKWEK